jgi:hypothetical protein
MLIDDSISRPRPPDARSPPGNNILWSDAKAWSTGRLWNVMILTFCIACETNLCSLCRPTCSKLHLSIINYSVLGFR